MRYVETKTRNILRISSNNIIVAGVCVSRVGSEACISWQGQQSTPSPFSGWITSPIMDRITDPYYQALWRCYITYDFLHVRYSSTCTGNPTRYTPVLQHPTFPTDALSHTFP